MQVADRSLASIFTPAAASGVKLLRQRVLQPRMAEHAVAAAGDATRTPLSVCATNTPTSAKREAGCLNLM
jgi:hypothetical protein